MKKIMLIFISIVIFMIFFKISLGRNIDKGFSESFENKIIECKDNEVIDIFTPYLLNSDKGKTEVRFIISSNRVVKIDMYTWKGKIPNIIKVHVDPNSTKYKKMISKITKIIIRNSKNRNFNFDFPY